MARYKKLADKEWLYTQYVENLRSGVDMAEEIGCCKTSVYRALKRHGIERREHTSKYDKLNDKEWLLDAYFEQERSLNDIAEEVGSTPGNVGAHLQQIAPLRTIQEGVDLRDTKDGEAHPNWQGGRVVRSGYVLLYAPKHPGTTEGHPYVQEHRLVAEEHLGRYLEDYEVVHHLNGKRYDNRWENLEVMVRGEHVSKHFQASHEVVRLRAENRRLRKELKKYREQYGELE